MRPQPQLGSVASLGTGAPAATGIAAPSDTETTRGGYLGSVVFGALRGLSLSLGLLLVAGCAAGIKSSFDPGTGSAARFSGMAPGMAPDTTVERSADGPAQRFDGRWRTARNTLRLAPSGPSTGGGPFFFSGLQATSTEVRVVPAPGVSHARIRMSCDGPVALAGVTHPAGRTFEFAVAAADLPAGVTLRPAEALGRCDGAAFFAEGSRNLVLLREEAADRALAALDSRFDLCAAPAGGDALERAFHAGRPLSQTCVFALRDARTLIEEKESFDAKVRALLGRPLPARFYDEGDPELPLDFSAAPRLSLIYLSYLDIKADFSGRVIERLVRHHAARGAAVRIVVSDVLTHGKDRALLEALAADHHNVRLKMFRWEPRWHALPTERLSALHRVHHAKLLAALSPEPGRSTAILGGRNIHDGFLFAAPVNLSSYSHLQQYRRGGFTLNYYSNWSDLDVAVHDDRAVRLLAAHLSTLWHDDADTKAARPFSRTTSDGAQAHAGGNSRHFISVPYADGRALEAYYIDLFNAAEHTIEIVNPYLNLTEALTAALEQALARGVEVVIVGRVDLSGDLAGGAVTAVNKAFVERFGNRIAIFDFNAPDLLLHSKILMIDRRLVILSSVNLNNRSFIHDNENGLAVLDPGFYRKMKRVFDEYRLASSRVTTARVPFYWRLLSFSRPVREMF